MKLKNVSTDPRIYIKSSVSGETYSKEELIAEIGSAMLCTITKIDHVTIDNSASYIEGWLRELKSDKKFIIQASASTQKAVDYIHKFLIYH